MYTLLGDSIRIVQALNVALGVGTVALTYGAAARSPSTPAIILSSRKSR